MMDEKTYLSHGGEFCPKCGADEVVAGQLVNDTDATATRDMQCATCGLEYTEHYALKAYTIK